MIYTITFSKTVDGVRSQYMDGENPITITVEADSKTSAINSQATKSFCQGNGVTVRSVN